MNQQNASQNNVSEEQRADKFEDLFFNFYETEVKEFDSAVEKPRSFIEKPLKKQVSNYDYEGFIKSFF